MSLPVLLVVDVGNTNTVLGLYDDDKLTRRFRLATRRDTTSDEMGALILSLLERHGVTSSSVTGAIMASVVPPVNRATLAALKDYLHIEPVVVGPGTKTGMPILTDQPAEVGADRIVNAVAAWSTAKCPLIIVDFGTATTFDAVNGKGEYLGGAIAPGIDVSMDALFVRAAKLPRIEIARPKRVIGKNTVSALQAGLFYGYVGLVDEVVSRMREELGGDAKVIATGGLARHFSEVCETLDAVDEDLTLTGLRLIYLMNDSAGPKDATSAAPARPTKR